MKHICAVIYIYAVKCNAKTKKIQISEALPSVMTKTLGKETQFAECYYQETRRKAILKKPKYCLKNIYRVSYSATLGICLLVAESNTRRKGFLKNPNTV